MKKLLIVTFLLTIPAILLAQVVPDTSLVPEAPGVVIGYVTELIQSVTGYKDIAARSGALIAIAGLLATAFRFLLALLKTFSGVFKNKITPKVAALVLGLLVYVASVLVAGVPWYEAVILAGSGPGAILVNELLKMIPQLRKKDA